MDHLGQISSADLWWRFDLNHKCPILHMHGTLSWFSLFDQSGGPSVLGLTCPGSRKLSVAKYIFSNCGRSFRIFSSSAFPWSTEPWTIRTYSLAIFVLNLISLLGLIQRLICENESLWISWSCEKMIKWINLLFIPIIIIDKNLRNDDVNKLTFHTFWWRHD